MHLIPAIWMVKEEAVRLDECAMRVLSNNPLRTTAESDVPRNKKRQLRLQMKFWREVGPLDRRSWSGHFPMGAASSSVRGLRGLYHQEMSSSDWMI